MPILHRTIRSKAFFGWRVVAGAFVLAIFGWGLGFYGPAIYLHEVQVARGWSLPLVSAAVTVHFLVGAVVVANLPALYRRFGLPLVTTLGATLLALGVFGWAVASAPWQLFAATLFSGAGWVAMAAAAVNAILAPWFVRARPAALATAYNGASVGGILFAPLWVAAIDLLGFPLAAAIIGVAMALIIAILSATLFARKPEAMGLKPDGDAPDQPSITITMPDARPLPGALLWRDRKFLTLTAGMALGLFAQVGLLAHLFSHLVPALGAQKAGLAMGLATACAIGGRMLVGWLMPTNADRRIVACVSYAVQIVASLLFILADGSSVPLLLLGIVLFGSGIGNATSLPPLIAQVEFVRPEVQRVVALIVAGGQGAYAFAPAFFGAMLSLDTGSIWFFPLAALIQALAIVSFWLGRRPRS